MLTVRTITAEARAIAEHDGLDQVSMRELAHRLRCTPRALYRHVTGKEAVLELVADSAFADLPGPRTDLPWDEAFLEFFTAMRRLLVGVPAIALIVAQLPVAGEQFRRHADALTAVMEGAGFDPAVAVEAVIALAQYTLGASLPGTGDALFDAHRQLGARPPDADVPTLQRRVPGFPSHSAEHHFRSALRHLVAGYAVSGDPEGAAPP